MADTSTAPSANPEDVDTPNQGVVEGIRSLLRTAEVDTRLLGMLAALLVIWVGFHVWSGGTFLTPRNLWNLSVQTSAVAIMATGMVLIIVSRNIDLSIGSLVGLIGMVMALVQTEVLPDIIGFDHSATWIIVLTVGVALGALLGGFQGFIIAYVGVPSFIVTLGGLLAWRGLAFTLSNGRTIAPLDRDFQLLGGGIRGSIGGGWSWVVGLVACAGIVALLVNNRRRRHKFGFRLRPLWVTITLGTIAVTATLGGVWTTNRYYLPESVARQRIEARGIPFPEGGVNISRGIAVPVLLMIGATLIMTFIATRRRFGRYVFAIGGNPEAAELGGINTRWTIVKTFIVMGMLTAIAAAITTARLNAAVSGLGQLSELFVIAAAVIGGTSFSGGVGTISGAVLGALVMQSLQSGMVLIGLDTAVQDIVVGIVLVVAVAIDSYYRRRAR